MPPSCLSIEPATPTAAAKQCYVKLPQGQVLWKEQFIAQNETKCQLIFTVSWSALGKQKGALVFTPCAPYLGAHLGRSRKCSMMLLTRYLTTSLALNMTSHRLSFGKTENDLCHLSHGNAIRNMLWQRGQIQMTWSIYHNHFSNKNSWGWANY